MRKLITLIFLIYSSAGFSDEFVKPDYKKLFMQNYSVIQSENIIVIREKFGSHLSIQATNGLILSGKNDRHINTQYTIIKNDGGNIEIEFTQKVDLRSFGDKLKIYTGTFYVSYK